MKSSDSKNNPKLPNKIITWNVNGIRASVKKGAFQWLIESGADIFCIQETKAHPEQLDVEIRQPQGYKTFFDHSKLRKGYSGVAVYSKIDEIGFKDTLPLSPDKDDLEGRFLEIEYEDFILINCYFPNGGGDASRLEYKLGFYDAMIKHIEKNIKNGKEVIVCGDFNIVHKEKDAKRFKENAGNIGFLPEEQAKLDKLVEIGCFDVFRHYYPDVADVYTWWDMKTFARERGIGWRIDTFFATSKILESIKNIEVNADVLGSDHCPVTIYFK